MMAMLLQQAARLLSLQKRSPALLILMYHRVLETPDPFLSDDISVADFSQQMEILAESFNAFTLSEAVYRMNNGTLPSASVVVTFDDGYRDNYTLALPALEAHGIPATFFVASGFLDGGRMWNDTIIEALRRQEMGALDLSSIGLGVYDIRNDKDRVCAIHALIGSLKYHPMGERQDAVDAIASIVGKSLPEDLMMSGEQVNGLHKAGMEIGGHTCFHPILSQIDIAEAETEIISGRNCLQEMIGHSISAFAFPNGKPGKDYQREHVELLKKHGFNISVSTSWGCVTAATDRLQLPRIAPWDRTRLKYSLRLLRAYRQTQSARYV